MRSREVMMFNTNGHLLKIFDSTEDCAKYFGYTMEYINHNIKYCFRIKKDGTYYVIDRPHGKKLAKYFNIK